MDPYSPFAPACLRVLVLPVGHVDRTTFLHVLSRLQEEASIIPLADVLSLLDADDAFLHAPNASSKGSLLYDYTTSALSEHDQQLSPFELFREPLLVVGVVDGLNFSSQDGTAHLQEAATYISKRHPRVVHRELMMLGVAGDGPAQAAESDSVVIVDRHPEIVGASLRHGIRKISARFLKEFSTYTKAMQVSPSIQTPGQTARSLQGTMSQRDSERRPDSRSGQSTPTPSQSNEAMSPVDDTGSRPPSSPATSFDHIPGASNTAAGPARADSRASARSKPAPRASSQDRVAVQGFGSNTSQDKLKQRGKARVGLVVGSIYMMAGQWSEALSMLIEHTNKARLLGDHIWHGKGLDNIVVCLLLHSWAGMELQIPSICYMTADKSSQRFSVNLASDSRGADTASIRSLSTTLPELIKLMSSLYRGGEGLLDLPPVPIAEAMVRFGKMLAALHISNGKLDHTTLDRLVSRQRPHDFARSTAPSRAGSGFSAGSFKAAISDILSPVVATGLDNVTATSQVGILAGVASVYGLVGMDRKKGMAMKMLVTKLGKGLDQVVKQKESGASKASTSQRPDQSGTEFEGFKLDTLNMDGLMTELGRIYGLPLTPSDDSAHDQAAQDMIYPDSFGNALLKTGILRELMRSFGAEPEKSLMSNRCCRLAASFLRLWGPHTVEDTQNATTPRGWRPEVAAVVADVTPILEAACKKHPDMNLPYWDPFLVRGVQFHPLKAPLRVHRRAMNATLLVSEQPSGTPENPLLYDPSASRPGTAEKPKQTELVVGEMSKCLITLQNPFNIAMQVECIRFDTDDIEVVMPSQVYELKPLRLQNVLVRCTPRSAGAFSIDRLHIKMKGVQAQMFPIMKAPHVPKRAFTLKAMGHDAMRAQKTVEDMPADVPGGESMSILVAASQPLLVLDGSEITESAIMLLAGEQRSLTIILRNVSNIPALVLQLKGIERVIRYSPDAESAAPNDAKPASTRGSQVSDLIQPGELKSFRFTTICGSGMYQGELTFLYGRVEEDSKDARLLTVPLNMSVIETLQITQLDIIPSHSLRSRRGNDTDGDECILCLEVANTTSSSISYTGGFTGASPTQSGTVDGYAAQRVLLTIPRLQEDDTTLDLEKATTILMERLWMTWHYNGREGVVISKNLKIAASALPSLLAAPMRLSLAVLESDSAGQGAHWTCKCGSFVTIRAMIANRAGSSGPLFVHMALPQERRMAITGTAKRFVAPVALGESAEVDFCVCPMLTGEVEVTVSVAAALPGEAGRSSERGVQSSLKLVVI